MIPLLSWTLAALAVAAPRPTDARVSMETSEGRQWWTVRADDAGLRNVLEQIARKSGRYLEGYESLGSSALVTVELVQRPLDQVLEYVLGSVGLSFELRRDTLIVLPADVEDLGREEILDQVSFSWLRAMTRFPGHHAAPAARLAQGELAEMRGNLGAARNHYQTLVEDYPDAEEVAEATMRTGRILQELGIWSQAAAQYRTLANLDRAAEYHAAARLELARCTVQLDDPQSALHMLEALDLAYPSADSTERTARQLVRAEALNARERYMEALRLLDRADPDLDPMVRQDALRIRAIALEGVGLPGEAGRAWLLYSEAAQRGERRDALEHAARLALQADDEMGALFVCRRAKEEGHGERFQRYELEARRRLGFDEVEETLQERRGEQIDQAEAWLAAEEIGRAAEILQPLYLGRAALGPVDATRVCVAWAACIESRQGVEEALQVLAEVRDSFETLELRSRIDVGAARLLEKNGLFDRAVDAYSGIYGAEGASR